MSDPNTLVQNIRKRFDHEAAKKTLKEKYEAKMLFAAFGGLWKATPELVLILESSLTNTDGTLILIDEYENPVRVVRDELLEQARMRYREQTNAWLQEYEEIQKQR